MPSEIQAKTAEHAFLEKESNEQRDAQDIRAQSSNQLHPNVSLTNLDRLVNVRFSGCEQENLELDDCAWENVTFINCKFNNTVFRKLRLVNVAITNCNFNNTAFKKVFLINVTFDRVDFYNAALCRLILADVTVSKVTFSHDLWGNVSLQHAFIGEESFKSSNAERAYSVSGSSDFSKTKQSLCRSMNTRAQSLQAMMSHCGE